MNPARQSCVALLAAGIAVSVLAVSVLIVAGCVTQPESLPGPAVAPAEFDRAEQEYRDAAGRGEPVYVLDGGDSVVRILVYRDGALARLGHDHAVTGRRVHGYAWLPADGAARADLYLSIAELVVDEPEARKAVGFKSEPTSADRDGTYRNMLLSLEADQFPTVALHVTVPTIDPNGGHFAPVITVDLTLHGTTQRLSVPAQIVMHGDGFHVTGSFEIRQTDFGITPFSVFGGALAVRDELELSFDLGFSRYR